MGPVLKTEFPYAHAVAEDKADKFCSYCMKVNNMKQMKRCTHCRFVHYCDSKCQKSDWADHKAECQSLVKIYPETCSAVVRLLARIIRKQERKAEPAFNQRTFDSLESHAKDIKNSRERYREFQMIAKGLASFMGSDNMPNADDLLQIYGKAAINWFEITGFMYPEACYHNGSAVTVGIGLYIGFSELNHSCDPDVYSDFDGAAMVIRALKHGVTKYDGKLRIAYCDLVECTSERRKILSERYFFTCNCATCQDTSRDAIGRSLRCGHCPHGYCPLELREGAVASGPICVLCGLPSTQSIDEILVLMRCLKITASKLKESRDPSKKSSKPGQVLSSLKHLLFVESGVSYEGDMIQIAKQLYTKGEAKLSYFNISLCQLAEELYIDIEFSSGTSMPKYNDRTVVCYRRFLREGSPQLCVQYFHAGYAYYMASNLEKAKKWFGKAVQAATEAFGSEHYRAMQPKAYISSADWFEQYSIGNGKFCIPWPEGFPLFGHRH